MPCAARFRTPRCIHSLSRFTSKLECMFICTTYQIPGPLGTHLYLQHLHKPSGRYVWQVVNYVGRIIIAILEFHHVHQEVAFELQFKKQTNK